MANVISSNGKLRQYTVPINVAQVLQFDINDDLQNSEFFLCNSDDLCYDECIHAMDMDEELKAGQIYFELPSSRLRSPLTASDMAALAVKASIALKRVVPYSKSDSNRGSTRRRQNRISPALEVNSSYGDRGEQMTVMMTEKKGNYVNPSFQSTSMKKVQRYSSRRPRLAMANRSSKVSLSTIYEGSVLL
ncbi:uncharacterized protein LOC124924184 [Impatiens glandulifera]|uniref:uncharacterized protein LOC124924184 n=1 Tax=Impatiens glandulifera TaxID=253017 RepID=UPI001FB0763D|nr:uncharacterized protein LOC124924184 [Impatiens glandulifera]